MTETVLITGATGLVGTHFLYYYRNRKDVHVKAIYQTNIPEHLEELSKEPWVTFIKADLTEIGIWTYIPMVDTIIHAATYGQPSVFMANASSTIMLNTNVTKVFLDEFLNEGGRFLFISTSELYSGAKTPYTEDMIGTTTPYHPRAPYIEGKRCGETIVNAYRQKGVDAKSVRLSLAYGEGTRKDDQRVMNQFIQRGIQDGEIKTRDKGEALRTYCYVGDAVSMMINILYKGKDAVYNIGGKSTLTIANLAHVIGDILGVPVNIGDEGGSAGAPEETRMSIYKYENEFGVVDFLPLQEGLARTIDFQKSLYL